MFEIQHGYAISCLTPSRRLKNLHAATVGKPGELRRVEVCVNRPQLVVRARSGYVVDESGGVVRAANTQRALAPTTVEKDDSLPISPNNDPLKRAANGRWICKSLEPPIDMVIVPEGFISHCPKSTPANDETNAWFIRKPGSRETVCKAFLAWKDREIAAASVPEGYVVTAEVKSTACGNSRDAKITVNAWEIRLPGPTEIVCKGFPLPRGYVMIGERFLAKCPIRATDTNAWLIRAK